MFSKSISALGSRAFALPCRRNACEHLAEYHAATNHDQYVSPSTYQGVTIYYRKILAKSALPPIECPADAVFYPYPCDFPHAPFIGIQGHYIEMDLQTNV